MPSFEWGGEDELGNDTFEEKRPGWARGPIHDMLVDAGVTIIFHGHDHFFGKQDLDGIICVECPVSSDRLCTVGRLIEGGYEKGEAICASGHLNLSVASSSVKLEYVRAYLPGDEEQRSRLRPPPSSKSSRAVPF